jgi:small-conductance mechanosensitive channel/CRP-like cAMP-binding protein
MPTNFGDATLNVGSIVSGGVLLALVLAARAVTSNSYIRSRLWLSGLLLAGYTIAVALAAFGQLPAAAAAQIHVASALVLAFSLANALVALAVNPWRVDRIPERFPRIVQDTIVIAFFGLVAMLFMPEQVFATTAVGAVVIGFALQDTLGNLFAGLAIQIEKPFRVGHWVTIGGKDGMVSEITWRATKIRTKSGNFVVVPNSVLSRDTITNYSEPTLDTSVEVEVGASYDTPPNEVKAAIQEALRGEPMIVPEPKAEVLLVDFAASAITYRVRVWTTDFAADERVRDRIRSRVYYAFRRHGIEIPYPMQVQMDRAPAAAASADVGRARQFDMVEILAGLTIEQRSRLADAARPLLFASGETIVAEGEPGASMFVLVRGEASVRLARTEGEVARLRDGAVFGEMSLLTGDARSATVAAETDCELLEIGADAFRGVVLSDPAVVERVASAVATRRAELERHRETRAHAGTAAETPQTLVARVRKFLGLPT